MRKRKIKTKKEKKIKLKASLKEKRHYIVFKIEVEKRKKINEKEIKEIINKAILRFLGILGYAKAGPLFIEVGKIDKEGFYIILSTLTKYVDKIKAACTLINIKGISVRCIGVSGTIKKVRQKFLSSFC